MASSADWIDDYIANLKKEAESKIQEALKETKKEFLPLCEKKIKAIYHSVIEEFYFGYNRSFYKPRGSLYDLLECKSDDEYVYISFNPSKITSRTGYSGENGLYQSVFREGWHGGAKFGDGAYYPWRKPPTPYDGAYKPWDDLKSFIWQPAVKAPISPLQDFKNRFDEYQDGEFESDFRKIWEKYSSRIQL